MTTFRLFGVSSSHGLPAGICHRYRQRCGAAVAYGHDVTGVSRWRRCGPIVIAVIAAQRWFHVAELMIS
jgi:hypothetical protein